jgi:hypothetical protein
MNLMVAGGYKSVDAVNPRKGHQEPSNVTIPIFDHRDCHYVRPNKGNS